ncbi:MAG: bifunctional 4-hydroxy-2-oxoglutarate aldolase/2-dehydro-3-deoxy-phosphogluconate aldolase [Bacteroidota bacterium]
MAKFTRIAVALKMKEQGMVPLFYQKDIATAKALLQAIYKGGARLLEFTNRGDYAHEIFAELYQFANKNMPDLMMGVGSVTDAGTASLYMQLGANFIVTPVLRKDIAMVCNRRKVLWSPGCGTLTEIAQAEELGCEVVKLFPGSTYGAGFVKSVLAPQPWTSIMPTGGVSPTRENLTAWFNAGVYCVGMGSKLMLKNADGTYDFKGIEALTMQTLALIEEIRAQSMSGGLSS